MLVPTLALLVAFQQPARAAPSQQPTASRPATQRAAARGPVENYDSTVATIVAVGSRVAEMKTDLDQYRRAVFNRTDANVVRQADQLRQSCQSLATTAERAAHTLCRSCINRQIRPTLDQYRAYLPRLGVVGRQCATRLRELSSGSESQSAGGLRREVRRVGNRIVLGLRPYEVRLEAVRRAFGWAAPATPTPRAN